MNNFKQVAATLIIGCSLVSPTTAQSASDEMDRMRREMEASMNQTVSAYNDYADAAQKEYLEYQKAVQAEYEEHCRKIKAMWGDDEVVESSTKTWVEYSDDQTQRSSVDFENGTVVVEVLVPVEELEDQSLINAKMGDAVGQLISSQGKMLNYESELIKGGVVSDTPVVGEQIDYAGLGITLPGAESAQGAAPAAVAPAPAAAPAPVAPTVGGGLAALPERQTKEKSTPAESMSATIAAKEKAEAEAAAKEAAEKEAAAKEAEAAKERERAAAAAAEAAKAKAAAATTVVAASQAKTVIPTESVKVVAEQIVEKAPVKVDVKSDETGKKVAVVSVEMKLSTNHITTRAAKYSSLITKYSNKFDIPEPIIYAVMEQESSFNPMAKSGAPAYGLMQLVPTSGGRDAYTYVHKTDYTPTPDYLYVPEQNIELGVGYIRKVMKVYMGKITDYNSRLICAIAAYNTGIGNVSRAITGNTNLSRAIPVINTMSYDEVYAKLSRDLIENETKNYIKQVPERIKKYSQEN
ncbi:MAG: murein transglycosylase domain-containing protein [Rikenellaceae bacterium]